MSRRRPWEEPIVYNEDRFPDQPSRSFDDVVGGPIIKADPDLILDPATGRPRPPEPNPSPPRPRPISKVPTGPIDSDPRSSGNPRPGWRDGIADRSNDDAPLNYKRGPHDGELDVDDRDEID